MTMLSSPRGFTVVGITVGGRTVSAIATGFREAHQPILQHVQVHLEQDYVSAPSTLLAFSRSLSLE